MIPRYETEAMRTIWNEEARFVGWTRVEVAACEAWHDRNEIPDDEMEAIREKSHHQSADRVREIEKETNHDVVAFVRAVGESVGEPASRHIHRGLTSSDVIDTALALSLRSSFEVLIPAVQDLQSAIGQRAMEHKHTLCAGRTHGIHAEPTTFGLRMAGWFTEIGRSVRRLETAQSEISVGKLSGAVGNFSQTDPEFERFVLDRLELQTEPVATQVIPRDRHAAALGALALLGAGIERIAQDIRSLQRTDIREAEEPFRSGQTGSSAMPHKRNPILSERLCGMSRLLRSYMLTAYENVALWHERDISHSSVERVTLPDAFHLAHYMTLKLTGLIRDMRVYPNAMKENIERAGGLLFSQSVLGVLLGKGLDRHVAYKMVQRNAMRVWEGQAPSLQEALLEDGEVLGVANAKELEAAFDPARYSKHADALFRRAGIE